MKSALASKKFATSSGTVGLLIVGLMIAPASTKAADLSLPVTGNVLGSVLDTAGVPQMGATVQLFNKYQRPIAKTLTSADGRFAFVGLSADLYAIRVSLASFLPASRDKIAVRPGTDSILRIHLATLLSSIEVAYITPTGAMSDDWKWVLRSSPATRPITRLFPDESSQSAGARLRPRVFSGTHAMLSVSGGDGGLIDLDSAQGDIGTGFAVSTNVFGKNQVQIGGTFGQNAAFGPSAMGICAIYSRDEEIGFGAPPEITLTVSQFDVAGPQGPAQTTSSPAAVRAMSLSIYETLDPVDNVHVEYGATGESVDYLQHTSRVSPFGRAAVDLGRAGTVVAAYSDGARPEELIAHQQLEFANEDLPSDDLTNAVNTLARVPQISYGRDRLELQSTKSYELGYQKTVGSRTYAVSAFRDDTSNGRLNVAGDISALDVGDLLSDGASKTSIYNIGAFDRVGYLASVTQRVNPSLDLALAYGRMGGFTANPNGFSTLSAPQQNFLDNSNHNFATLNLNARAPVAGTRISANYGWVDHDAIIPQHVFTTQNTYARPGLNIYIRQPLPSFFGIPGRLELTADVRNLLAQGYIPLNTADGRTVLLVQSARAIRGGLNFIF